MPPLPPLPSQYGIPARPSEGGNQSEDALPTQSFAQQPADASQHQGAYQSPSTGHYYGAPQGGYQGSQGPGQGPGHGSDQQYGYGQGGGQAGGSTRARKPRGAVAWAPVIITAAVVGLIAGGAGAYATNLAQPMIEGSSPSVVQAEAAEIDWTAVSDAVSNSVVSIQVASQDGAGQGSGVVWDDQGHVVTNHHVVESAANGGQIAVTIGNRAYPATLVGSDAATDLAVVKLDEIPEGLAAITRGDSTALEVGQDVMAVGNPLGLSGSVTTGIVSALDRPVSTGQIKNSLVVTNAIQTSAPLNPGNSGGALVDSTGALVGINSSIATIGGAEGASGSIGIGFAIPVNLVDNIAGQIIENGAVQHAYLGTSTTTGQAALSDGSAVLGAEVQEVVGDGPAEAAGIKKGDLIVAINDVSITSSEHLVGTVRALKVDETASFTVIRDGKEQTFEVTMGVSPDL
ncbi:Trypsin [Gulosibacter molinativorax]|nr:Trypsin [Gulosibacter molinativorax]